MSADKPKIFPTDDHLVVEPYEADSQTPGGIVIPDGAKEKPHRAKVVAVGPGRVLDNGERFRCRIDVGDDVLYERFAGSNVKLDGKDYTILRESEVLATL